MKQIDSGNIFTAETYIDLVIKMHVFFKELIEFSKKISKKL
jgi:hypothetical protein